MNAVSTNAFTAAFVAALALATVTRLWLAVRHMRHVRANRDRVPAEFAENVTLASHRKAADYTAARTRLGIIDTLVSAAVLLVFTLGGGLTWLYDAWARLLEGGGYAHGIALIVSVAAITSLVDLPFSIYRTFVVEARFGFNRMTPALFIADLAKSTALGLALGVPLLLAVLWLMAQMGNLWWLYVWLTWVAFNLAMLVAYPTLIAPLFNKFTPLADEALKARIERLLVKCGFRSKGLFVMDGSKRSSHGNAYFTGFGAAKRIVFFDTLLSRLAPAEVEAVLAHELGHFKRHHVWKRVVLAVSREPRLPRGARICHRSALVLRGAGGRAAQHCARTRAVRHGGAGLHLPAPPDREPVLAPPRIRGRRVRREPRERVGPHPRARQTLPGQRRDAHP